MKWNQYKAKEQMSQLIANRESKEGVLESNVNGNKSLLSIKIFCPFNQFNKQPRFIGELHMKVHADTQIPALHYFLKTVNDQNICIVIGPEGGFRFGLEGKLVENLNIFVDKSKLK